MTREMLHKAKSIELKIESLKVRIEDVKKAIRKGFVFSSICFSDGDEKSIYFYDLVFPEATLENALLWYQNKLQQLTTELEHLGSDIPKVPEAPKFPDGYIPGFTEWLKAVYQTDTIPRDKMSDITVTEYIKFVNGLTH